MFGSWRMRGGNPVASDHEFSWKLIWVWLACVVSTATVGFAIESGRATWIELGDGSILQDSTDGNSQIYVSIDEVTAEQGKTILVGVNVVFPENMNLVSAEIHIGGYGEDLSLVDVVTASSLIEDEGWLLQYNELDGVLITASAGADVIEGEGVFFWLQFFVSGTASGFVPIILESAIFNTGDLPVELLSGGVNVLPGYSGPIWHVSPEGSDKTGNGSEGNPFATIQRALNSAATGNTILVSDGTYPENIQITQPVSLIGVLGPESTIISASDTSTVIRIDHVGEPVEIRGFTLRDGYRSDGGGSAIESSESPYLTIDNCILRGNRSDTQGPRGGTIEISGTTSNVTIQNSIIVNNLAATGTVGGLYLSNNGVPVKMERVLIADNEGHAIYTSGGLIEITNCTVTNNQFGVMLDEGSIGVIRNSVLLGNEPMIDLRNFSMISVTYTDVSGRFSGAGNIDADPKFVDPSAGNYHLTTDSPCIDTGDPDFDQDGLTWEYDPDDRDPDGSRMDMGAFFYDKSALIPPQLIDYQPGEYDLVNWRLESIPLTFTRDMDISSVSPGITIAGSVSGTHSFTYDYNQGDRTLILYPETTFAAVETVAVTITPDLLDSEGVPFDGNGNGQIDPLGQDIFSWRFTTTLLGDYTLNGIVNGRDLALFREGWLDTSLHAERDIGPAMGELPHLVPQFDGKIDFEDLMIFAQMWNWSYMYLSYDDSTMVRSQRIVYGNPVHLTLEPDPGNGWLPVGQQRIAIAVDIDRFDSLGVFELAFRFNPHVLQFQGLENQLHAPWIVLDGASDGGDRLVVAGALLARRHPEEENRSVLRLHFTKLREAATEITTSATLWELVGQEVTYPENRAILDLRTPAPIRFTLHQNFPNPFNSLTTIRYELPSEADVRVGIFNVLGQEMVNLVKTHQSAGYYQVQWDGKNNSGQIVSTGLYFVFLRAGGFTASHKLLLIK